MRLPQIMIFLLLQNVPEPMNNSGYSISNVYQKQNIKNFVESITLILIIKGGLTKTKSNFVVTTQLNLTQVGSDKVIGWT